MTNPDLYEVLLIEDEVGDIELVKEVMSGYSEKAYFTVVTDGNSVAKDLADRVAQGQNLPALIILDLNLPGKNGFEVLAEIKSSEPLHHLPIVVMTSSGNRRDVRRSYELQANSYVQKAVQFDQFRRNVLRLAEFWFNAASLPTKAPAARM